jgi:hypothetical protein
LAIDAASRATVLISRRDADPLGRRRAVDDVLGLGEHDQAGRGVLRVKKIPVRRAARDLQIDQALVDTVAGDQLALDGLDLLRRGGGRHVELTQGALQAGQVGRVVHQAAVHDGGDLIDPIGEKKAAVEDGDLRLFLRQVGTIDVDGPAHRCPTLDWLRLGRDVPLKP